MILATFARTFDELTTIVNTIQREAFLSAVAIDGGVAVISWTADPKSDSRQLTQAIERPDTPLIPTLEAVVTKPPASITLAVEPSTVKGSLL